MAALANAMLFLPTAFDGYVQAQGATGSPPPNQGLQQILAPMTRTGATINSVAGFAYQGEITQVEALMNYVVATWPAR